MIPIYNNDSYLQHLPKIMFKTSLIGALLICISSSSFAEIQISEKVRPQAKSLVNPNIQRLDIPPHQTT